VAGPSPFGKREAPVSTSETKTLSRTACFTLTACLTLTRINSATGTCRAGDRWSHAVCRDDVTYPAALTNQAPAQAGIARHNQQRSSCSIRSSLYLRHPTPHGILWSNINQFHMHVYTSVLVQAHNYCKWWLPPKCGCWTRVLGDPCHGSNHVLLCKSRFSNSMFDYQLKGCVKKISSNTWEKVEEVSLRCFSCQCMQ
jgi:hypothetical protein